MNNLALFLLGAALAVALAIFWLSYLIKLVLNDEETRERIRQIIRRRDEQMRQLEEQRQRRRLADGLEPPAPTSASPPKPQDAINAGASAADRAERKEATQKGKT